MRLSRIFDVRAGEGRVAVFGFALLLLLIITAHTTLETARDALLLTGPGPRALGFVYVAIAVCTLPAAALAARAGVRFGPRRALAGTIAIAAIAALSLFAAPTTPATAVVVYVVSGVIASVVVPQFWTLVGTVFTLDQGRRLFGLIAAAGVLGGVLGSGTAAFTMLILPVKALLTVSAAAFVLAGVALARLRIADATVRARRQSAAPAQTAFHSVRDNPFLIRVALIVFLSTATLLAADYLFKSTVARTLPSAKVGPFVARYYLALNGLSLLVQLFVGSALVRRLGLAAAIVLTPVLLFFGASGAVMFGGAMWAVLLMKTFDGGLRHSIHRITGELIYLPVAVRVRERVKPLIDGALGRTAQTVTGATLLALSGTWLLTPQPFALVVATLAFAWVFAAVSMRRPYLNLLRSAISTGSLNIQDNPDPLDLESAQLLVQHLASEDPLEVVGAMNALSRRGREGFVPALVLLHHNESVLLQALEIFGPSGREDWIPPARRLLDDSREAVRMAAARALAMHDRLDTDRLANDVGPRVKGYVAVRLALRSAEEDLVAHPRVAALLGLSGEDGDRARLGLLAAIADAPPAARLIPLLLALGPSPQPAVEAAQLFARAAARQQDPRLIPALVSLLAVRAGRETVRAALVALGEPAFDHVHGVLLDETRARSLRVHIPKTLARFGTKRAAQCLIDSIETQRDGLIRYKSIRALGVVVSEHHIPIDRVRVERLCKVHLVEHFRMLALRASLEPLHSRTAAKPASAAERLLVGLMDDKLHQSLERAFRLLKIAHPKEDVHRMYLACLSGDAYARANAGELLDALLSRRDQQPVRALLQLIADDLPMTERVSRATALISEPLPRLREQTLTTLMEGNDVTLAALAGHYALELGGPSLRVAVDNARRHRPELDLGLLSDAIPAGAYNHA